MPSCVFHKDRYDTCYEPNFSRSLVDEVSVFRHMDCSMYSSTARPKLPFTDRFCHHSNFYAPEPQQKANTKRNTWSVIVLSNTYAKQRDHSCAQPILPPDTTRLGIGTQFSCTSDVRVRPTNDIALLSSTLCDDTVDAG